ncbi:MAG: formyltransferase family protein [archaeon]
MNIGIITSTIYDEYAIVIMNKLLKNNLKSKLVISEKLISQKNIKKAIKKVGYSGIIKFLKSRVLNKQKSIRKDQFLLKDYINENNIKDKINNEIVEKIVKVNSINDKKAVEEVKNNNIDVLIYCGGGILRNGIINSPKIGIINAHLGKLPEYRGMNVTEWMIYNYEQPVITTHFINKGIDTGEILLRKQINLSDCDNIIELRAKALYNATNLLVETIKGIYKNNINSISQSSKEGKQYFSMTEPILRLTEKRLELMSDGKGYK